MTERFEVGKTYCYDSTNTIRVCEWTNDRFTLLGPSKNHLNSEPIIVRACQNNSYSEHFEPRKEYFNVRRIHDVTGTYHCQYDGPSNSRELASSNRLSGRHYYGMLEVTHIDDTTIESVFTRG